MHSDTKYRLWTTLALIFFSVMVPFSNARANASRSRLCEQLLRGGWLHIDEGRTMPAGRFRGQPLSVASPAPALQVMTDEQAAILGQALPDNRWMVANFVTRQGAAIAALPKVAPKEISILVEQMAAGVNHLIVRMRFPKKHPVHFWPQNLDGILQDPFSTRDIVLEFGAHKAQGQEALDYSPLRGLVGHYALQARMGTTWFKVQTVRRERRGITEFRLPTSTSHRSQLLQRFLERADQINQGEMYHSVVRNCATEFQCLLHAAGVLAQGDKGLARGIIHAVISWVPSGVLWTLKKNSDRSEDIYEREIKFAPDDKKL